jgi:hypothetical protein
MQKQTSSTPFIQSLESRRLMSLNTAVIVPSQAVEHASAPIQLEHSPGTWEASNGTEPINAEPVLWQSFTLQSVDAPAFSELRQQPGEYTSSRPLPNDDEAIDAPFARSIAHDDEIIVSPTTDSTTSAAMASDIGTAATTANAHVAVFPRPTKYTTISSLYSTIGISTVAEIDAANLWFTLHGDASADQMSKTSDSNSGAQNATVSAPENVATGILLASFATTAQSTRTTDITNLYLPNDHAGQIVPAQLATAQLGNDTPADGDSTSVLSRTMLQTLEQQLMAVKARSRDLIWNIDRDYPAELSHGQSSSDSLHEGSNDWKTTATVVAAAIASIVYAEKEMVHGKKNVGSIFSVRPLRSLASF